MLVYNYHHYYRLGKVLRDPYWLGPYCSGIGPDWYLGITPDWYYQVLTGLS